MMKNWTIKDSNGNSISIGAPSRSAAKYHYKRMIRGAEITEIICDGEVPQKKIVRLNVGGSVSEFKPVDTIKVTDSKIKANEKCPCGSGRKYKKCCMRKGKAKS